MKMSMNRKSRIGTSAWLRRFSAGNNGKRAPRKVPKLKKPKGGDPASLAKP